MAVHYWLSSCCLSDEETEKIEPLYTDACSDFVIPANICSWIEKDENTLLEEDHSSLHEFTWSFNIDSMNELVRKLLAIKEFTFDESNIIDFIDIADMPPISLIAYGIGASKFNCIPGVMGVSLTKNSILKDKPYSEVLDKATLTLAESRIESFLSAAYSVCGSPPAKDTLHKIINFYTNAEREALLRNSNLLTLSTRFL